MRPLFLSICLILSLSACAKPSLDYSVAAPEIVETEAQRQERMVEMARYGTRAERGTVSPSTRLPMIQRLTAVAERVLISAAPYCGNNIIQGYPVSVGTPDNGYAIVINAAGDLRPGDRIIDVDGNGAPRGRMAFEALGNYGGMQAAAGQPLRITALRGNQQIRTTYTPVPVCRMEVVLEDNNTWNAYADGKQIHVERKLMRDLSNDDELAFVLAHELSHNLLGHVGKSQQNVLVGAAAGMVIESIVSAAGGGNLGGSIAKAGAMAGQMTYSKEFEREADYVGMYILANTGYDLDAGPRVARAIARQDARSIRYASSHPSSAERAASLNATINEIDDKMRTNQPLVPNHATKK